MHNLLAKLHKYRYNPHNTHQQKKTHTYKQLVPGQSENWERNPCSFESRHLSSIPVHLITSSFFNPCSFDHIIFRSLIVSIILSVTETMADCAGARDVCTKASDCDNNESQRQEQKSTIWRHRFFFFLNGSRVFSLFTYFICSSAFCRKIAKD